MPNFVDRTQQRFGRLLIVARAPNVGKIVAWKCLCDCGNKTVIRVSSIGKTFSCGCLQKEATAASNVTRVKHGQARGHKPSPEWRSWSSMHDRCSIPSTNGYHRYGGRGIKVCQQWTGKEGFAQFYKDMGARPVGMSLDRIDGDGNYEPSNCKWSTASEQAANRHYSSAAIEKRNKNLAMGHLARWKPKPKDT